MSAPSTLPDGWTETTFGAVVSAVSVNDKKLPRGQYLESGRYPVVDQGQQFVGGYSDDDARVVSEDLPLLVFGDHTRVFKYLNHPFVPGADGVKVLKPLGVDAKWLFEIAHALEFPDKGYARHYQHLKSARLLVPPLPEQQRIVAEIEKQFTRLEAGVAALRRVQANLKRYRAAVLKAACEGQLVPTEAELSRSQSSTRNSQPTYETGEQLLKRILTERRKHWTGRGQYKEPAASDTTILPPLSEGWTWASVEQISSKVVDGVHKKPNYVPSGIPFVTVRNLTAGPGISFEKLNYITPEDHEEFIKRANPEPGDVLVSKDGTLGVIRVIKTDVVFSIFVSVAMVKPVLREMSNFLGYALSSPQVQAQMIPKGSGLQHIHLEDLREDCVPLPPLAEQTRIVAEVERRLSVVEELESVVSTNLQRAARLRQSVLQKAFTGEF